MSTPRHARYVDVIARRGGTGADAAGVADVIIGIWQHIELVLTPVVGGRGVSALLQRSLFVATRAQDQLRLPAGHSHERVVDLAWLRSTIAAADAPAATALGAALLAEFNALLSSLIGDALTHRLLAPVWELPSSGDAAQDVQP